MVRRTLDGMSAGGLYDVVGGGFHRYSVDARWLVPHFEKMLYDNALLASTYLHAWVVTGEERYRVVVEETIAYLLREMRLESGGFASAQDADTEGVEGLTYTWTPAEWEELGLDPALLEPFEHGRSIVRGELDAETKARLLAIRAASAAAVPRRQGDRRLERPRARRARGGGTPARARGLARGGRGARRRSSSARFAATTAACSGASATGRVSGPGFLDDHANVAHGLLELHVATGDPRWLLEARRIADLAVELFADDERGGFFLAPHDGERARDAAEGPRRRPDARRGTRCSPRCSSGWGASGATRRSSSGAPASCGSSRRRWSGSRARSRGRSAPSTSTSRRRASSRSSATSARTSRAPRSRRSSPRRSSPSARPRRCRCSRGKALVDGLPAVYVCERFACRAPVTRAEDSVQLDSGEWRRPS